MHSPLSIETDYSKRVFGLDLMRAIAIINVVIVHASWMDIFPNYPGFPIIPGVELFFVLSGFLIGTILLKIFINEETFGLKQVKKFWIRRWFRTLPNYYLILILNIIVVYFGIINGNFSQFNWKFFLFVQNLTSEFHGFFWESWSLSIEEWFYLSFPIVLILFNLAFRKSKIEKRYVFLVNIIFYLCFSMVMRAVFGTRLEIENGFWYDVKIHKVIIYHLDGIALGLLGAYLKHYFSTFWHKSRNITFIIGLAICLVIPHINFNPTNSFTIIFKISMQSIGCFLLLPRFETIKTAPKFLTKIVTHISLISYSMYLINLSLVSSVITSNIEINDKPSAIVWYSIYWLAVIIFSTLIYKYFEKPVMDLRDKIKI